MAGGGLPFTGCKGGGPETQNRVKNSRPPFVGHESNHLKGSPSLRLSQADPTCLRETGDAARPGTCQSPGVGPAPHGKKGKPGWQCVPMPGGPPAPPTAVHVHVHTHAQQRPRACFPQEATEQRLGHGCPVPGWLRYTWPVLQSRPEPSHGRRGRMSWDEATSPDPGTPLILAHPWSVVRPRQRAPELQARIPGLAGLARLPPPRGPQDPRALRQLFAALTHAVPHLEPHGGMGAYQRCTHSHLLVSWDYSTTPWVSHSGNAHLGETHDSAIFGVNN